MTSPRGWPVNRFEIAIAQLYVLSVERHLERLSGDPTDLDSLENARVNLTLLKSSLGMGE